MVRYATVTTIMEFGVEQNTVKYCRYYGIIGKENHIFEAKIQKIYSEEIGMCSNDINVEKKQCFG